MFAFTFFIEINHTAIIILVMHKNTRSDNSTFFVDPKNFNDPKKFDDPNNFVDPNNCISKMKREFFFLKKSQNK